MYPRGHCDNVVMKRFTLLTSTLATCALLAGSQSTSAANYPENSAPLAPEAFIELPLGTVKPDGWLRSQLQIQARGLTGHLDEFWESLFSSAWKGLDGDAWERGPYYLDGLVPLAYLLDDQRLISKIRPYIEYMLMTRQDNGWFGPVQNTDRWPLAVAMKVLTQYYEATGDERVMELLKSYFQYIVDTPPDWPDDQWRGVRAMENCITAHWMYRRTQDPMYLKAAESIFNNCYRWDQWLQNFAYTDEATTLWRTPKTPADKLGEIRYGLLSHGVNIAMALKYPGLKFQQTGDDTFHQNFTVGLNALDRYHGQVTGLYACDEHLSGTNPTQGTELCTVVEMMYSLENLMSIWGTPALGDRLESLAYNALPGTITADFWAHQYDQQANQVLCTQDRRKWSTNGDSSNLYGLEPHFGCCTANMHQGWPKFVASMWMATKDNGLAAVALGPNMVSAKVGNGVKVNIIQETEYPFQGDISFTIASQEDVAFPLYIRIPAWAEGAKLVVGKKEEFPAPAGAFACITREWKNGEKVKLTLPMGIRSERRYHNSIAIFRGPLVFSLEVGQYTTRLKSHSDVYRDAADWEYRPASDWNYALLLDPEKLNKAFRVKTSKVSVIPFAQVAAPVTLSTKACLLEDWGMEYNSAGELPLSPVNAKGLKTRTVKLVPYGCTQLRITEFPLAQK